MKFDDAVAYHHLMSRTVNGEALFGGLEREVMRKMIWQVAEFSGVRVITYAVMKNHFHLLVEVRECSEVVSDEELVRRYRILYPKPTPWQPMSAEAVEAVFRKGGAEAESLRKILLSRMNDVSELMKTLKQRFTLWFNRSHNRFGPLWAERFKSVLVEGDHFALETVAAYIDLNPVRAGIVKDPKDYRFCGYGEAVGGGRLARSGLLSLYRSLKDCRQVLFGAAYEERSGKSSVDREEALRVLNVEKGSLPLHVLLRCRVRYFTDGFVLGSPSFVERSLNSIAETTKRSRKPHAVRGTVSGDLAVGRGLRKNLFS